MLLRQSFGTLRMGLIALLIAGVMTWSGCTPRGFGALAQIIFAAAVVTAVAMSLPGRPRLSGSPVGTLHGPKL